MRLHATIELETSERGTEIVGMAERGGAVGLDDRGKQIYKINFMLCEMNKAAMAQILLLAYFMLCILDGIERSKLDVTGTNTKNKHTQNQYVSHIFVLRCI